LSVARRRRTDLAAAGPKPPTTAKPGQYHEHLYGLKPKTIDQKKLATVEQKKGVLSVADIVKIVNAVDSAQRLLEDIQDLLKEKGWEPDK